MSKKWRVEFVLFCLELALFAKIKRRPDFYTFTETSFINNSRSKQNIKNPKHPFVDIGKTETCAKFQQKNINCTIVELVKVFNFLDK